MICITFMCDEEHPTAEEKEKLLINLIIFFKKIMDINMDWSFSQSVEENKTVIQNIIT